jgi:NADH:ubiquinone oxidoreductase subunit F (NADH-binding)
MSEDTNSSIHNSNHYSGWKVAFNLSPDEIIGKVKSAGLRGFGGAGFPVAAKWEICRNVQSDQKYIICNANQEPGSLIITELSQKMPEKVFEGMMICAIAVGASKGIVCINEGNGNALGNFRKTLDALYASCLPKNPQFDLEIEIIVCRDGIVSGEETAILNSIEGKPPITNTRPPFPAVRGLYSKPTVIHSAETFAHVPEVFTDSANRFSKLCTVSGCVKKTGIVEVTLGTTTIREIIDQKCNGLSDGSTLKAVLVGGTTGTFAGPDDLDMPLEFEGKLAIGSAIIQVFDQNTCIANWLNRDLAVAKKELCGKCMICRNGIYQLSAIINDIIQRKARSDDFALIEELCLGIQVGACCNFGRDAVKPVLSALKLFPEELDIHIKRGRCPALVCSSMITFHILGETCKGCGKCAQVCPVKAIRGSQNYIHVIDQSICTKCGQCFDVCQTLYGAVTKASGVPPKVPSEPIPVGTFVKKSGLMRRNK